MALKGYFAGLIAAFVLVCSSAVAAEKTYVNGIDADYPPFAFLDAAGKPTGFDVESMNWIAKKMGFKIEHKAMEWDGIIPSLLAKKIDMVCSGMSISPERKAKVTFTDPYWSIRKYLVVKADSSLDKDTVLKGKKTIGVQGGTNESEFLQKENGKNGWEYTLKFYESPLLAIDDLLNGRIDAGAIDSAPAEDAIKKGKKPIKILGEFAEPDDFGVATRNDDSELREKINKGYELLKKDPYWEELQAKYLHK